MGSAVTCHSFLFRFDSRNSLGQKESGDSGEDDNLLFHSTTPLKEAEVFVLVYTSYQFCLYIATSWLLSHKFYG